MIWEIVPALVLINITNGHYIYQALRNAEKLSSRAIKMKSKSNLIIYIYSIIHMIDRDRFREERKNWEVDVSNLPQHLEKEDIVHFLWKTLENCHGLIKQGNPIIHSAYSSSSRSLKLHLRSGQQAQNMLFLDRLYYGQKVLLISSAIVSSPAFTKMNISKLKRVNYSIGDQFKKVYVGNLPSMPLHELMNVLSEFGELKALVEVRKDSVGICECYCEYAREESMDQALSQLNGKTIRGRNIVMKRAALMNASESKTKITSKVVGGKVNRFEKDLNQFYTTFDTVGYFKNKTISCILSLRSIIPANSNISYVIEDIRKQLDKVGNIIKITYKNQHVYVEYQRVQYSQIAYLLLQNRKYDGKQVEVMFYDPIKFADDILV